MQKEYGISGMTCAGCVAKVEQAVSSIAEVEKVDVQLDYPQLRLSSAREIDLSVLREALAEKGEYQISDKEIKKPLAPLPPIKRVESSLPNRNINTYKPLILIVSFIAGVSLLVQFPFDELSWELWMRHFMAGFFIVFAFFKLLNLKGFSNSYAMYDIVAAQWKPWGLIYPFIELSLGILYLIDVFPFYVNLSTAIILGISSIGVIRSNLNKKQIKCACLGDVFNLPMSTVTIVEDLTMVAMAVIMLFTGE